MIQGEKKVKKKNPQKSQCFRYSKFPSDIWQDTDLGSNSQIKRYIWIKNNNVFPPSVSFSGRCAVRMFLCYSVFFYFPPNMPVQHLSLQKHNSLNPSSDSFKAQNSLAMVNIHVLWWFFPSVTHPKPLGLIGNRNRNVDHRYQEWSCNLFADEVISLFCFSMSKYKSEKKTTCHSSSNICVDEHAR